MDKSNKMMYFAFLALVFVGYYFVTGSQDAVGDTLKSVLLVGLASVLTYAVIREQKKRGRMSV
jgi:hypothetical protein